MRYLPLLILSCIFICMNMSYGQQLELIAFAENLRRPVDIAHAGDDRLFIVEKDGTIAIVRPNGFVEPVPYLDIRNRVNAFANERGLLGVAFHPDYSENGYFYVHYTNAQGHSVISRFSVSQDNPDIALSGSELILLTVNQPFNNHNAGDLNFGPDGYLYIGMGDGGNAGDPGNRSQNPKNLLGKMLRINVDEGLPYTIPNDNPFAGNQDTLEEIWSIGWRNPWRFSFDKLTGDMWIADVGQNAWEEINMEPSGVGGLNYGWRCYEGNSTFNTSGCRPRENYTFPVHVYPNRFDVGCSVTGGYVYRGNEYPKFYGKYIYTDFCTGIFWTLERVNENWQNTQLADLDNNDFSSFGEDYSGELYVVGLGSGKLFKLTDKSCTLFNELDLDLIISESLCPDICTGEIMITGETAGLTVNWFDGDTGLNKTELCPGVYNIQVSDVQGCSRNLTAELTEPSRDSVFIIQIVDTLLTGGSPMESYNWYYNGEFIETTTSPFFMPEQSGNYFAIGINSNGCFVDSDTISFILSHTKNLKTPKDFAIIKNPVDDKVLGWTFSGNLLQQVAIFDMQGKVALSGREIPPNTEGKYYLGLDDLLSGYYILVVNGRGLRFLIL